MDRQEISEQIEHAQHSGQKRIGMTMAITAVFLSITGMLGHRVHSDELVTQTRAVDKWDYYQAKNNRSRMHADNAKLAALQGERGAKLAEEFSAEAERQRKGAEDLQKEARALDDETQAWSRKADIFDLAEIVLEVSIVLCSIALLAEVPLYWRASFLTTALGVGLTVFAYLRH